MVCDRIIRIKWDRLIEIIRRGRKCQNPACGISDISVLQFAHIKDTKVMGGKGRGSYTRIRDVKENLNSYLLLCSKCHIEFDYHGLEISIDGVVYRSNKYEV